MKRIKWLTGEWPISIRLLAQRIRADAITPERMSGFLVTRVKENSIEARFIEKFISEDQFTDPFGNEVRFERVSYTETSFKFSDTFPEVELLNPPRSLGAFSSRILKVCDFRVGWSQLSVDVLMWAEAIQTSLKRGLVIEKAHVRDVLLTPSVNVEATLVGSQDVRDSIRKLIGTKPYTLDKLQFAIEATGRAARIQLASDGSVQGPDSLSSEAIDIVRSALPQPAKTH